MTYAKLIFPYNPTDNDVSVTPKEKLSLKGKLKSAYKKGKAGLKNAIDNPGQTMKNLGKYMQQGSDKLQNKFSGIAMAQLLADGKITNKSALDYLFLGALPALNQNYAALGYAGLDQMKEALTNGTIDVGAFVSGFSKSVKGITDLKNKVQNINNFQNKNIIELDITYSHSESYQSEIGDRRVQEGMSWGEYIHNLPEIFTLNCGIQDGKRYSVQEFKDTLKFLRKKKVPLSIEIDEEITDTVFLQNFSPVREGPTNAVEYALEFKKIPIGSVELTPITITALPTVEAGDSITTGSSGGGTTLPNMPNYDQNPYDKTKRAMKNKRRSWAKSLFEPEG